PGQTFTSFNLSLTPAPFVPQVVTGQASQPTVLLPGVTYWLYGTASNPAADWPWLVAAGNLPGTGAISNAGIGGLGWRLQPGDFLPAFAIFGTPAAPGCP